MLVGVVLNVAILVHGARMLMLGIRADSDVTLVSAYFLLENSDISK